MAIVEADDIRQAVKVCRDVFVHPVLEDYLLDIVQATREDSALDLGVSPRGSLAFYRTVQALAAIQGRTYVTPDDIQQLAPPVLRHRLIPARTHVCMEDRSPAFWKESFSLCPFPWRRTGRRALASQNRPTQLAHSVTDLEQELEAAVSPEATVNGPAADERSSISG